MLDRASLPHLADHPLYAFARSVYDQSMSSETARTEHAMSITIHGEDHGILQTITGDHSRASVKDLIHKYAGAYA